MNEIKLDNKNNLSFQDKNSKASSKFSKLVQNFDFQNLLGKSIKFTNSENGNIDGNNLYLGGNGGANADNIIKSENINFNKDKSLNLQSIKTNSNDTILNSIGHEQYSLEKLISLEKDIDKLIEKLSDKLVQNQINVLNKTSGEIDEASQGLLETVLSNLKDDAVKGDSITNNLKLKSNGNTDALSQLVDKINLSNRDSLNKDISNENKSKDTVKDALENVDSKINIYGKSKQILGSINNAIDNIIHQISNVNLNTKISDYAKNHNTDLVNNKNASDLVSKFKLLNVKNEVHREQIKLLADDIRSIVKEIIASGNTQSSSDTVNLKVNSSFPNSDLSAEETSIKNLLSNEFSLSENNKEKIINNNNFISDNNFNTTENTKSNLEAVPLSLQTNENANDLEKSNVNKGKLLNLKSIEASSNITESDAARKENTLENLISLEKDIDKLIENVSDKLVQNEISENKSKDTIKDVLENVSSAINIHENGKQIQGSINNAIHNIIHQISSVSSNSNTKISDYAKNYNTDLVNNKNASDLVSKLLNVKNEVHREQIKLLADDIRSIVKEIIVSGNTQSSSDTVNLKVNSSFPNFDLSAEETSIKDLLSNEFSLSESNKEKIINNNNFNTTENTKSNLEAVPLSLQTNENANDLEKSNVNKGKLLNLKSIEASSNITESDFAARKENTLENLISLENVSDKLVQNEISENKSKDTTNTKISDYAKNHNTDLVNNKNASDLVSKLLNVKNEVHREQVKLLADNIRSIVKEIIASGNTQSSSDTVNLKVNSSFLNSDLSAEETSIKNLLSNEFSLSENNKEKIINNNNFINDNNFNTTENTKSNLEAVSLSLQTNENAKVLTNSKEEKLDLKDIGKIDEINKYDNKSKNNLENMHSKISIDENSRQIANSIINVNDSAINNTNNIIADYNVNYYDKNVYLIDNENKDILLSKLLGKINTLSGILDKITLSRNNTLNLNNSINDDNNGKNTFSMEKILGNINKSKESLYEVNTNNSLFTGSNIIKEELHSNNYYFHKDITQKDNGSKNNNSFNAENKFLKGLLEDNKDMKFDKVNTIIGQLAIQNSKDNIEMVDEPKIINRSNFTADIIKSIKYMETENVKDMTVKINPKELGEIYIKVTSTADGVMKANITANSRETFNLLNAHVQELNNNLNNSQIKVHHVDINIYNGDTTFFSNNFNQPQQGDKNNSQSQSYNEAIYINGEEESAASDQTIYEDNKLNKLA